MPDHDATSSSRTMATTTDSLLAEALRLGRNGLPLGLANLTGIAMVSTDLAFLGREGSTAMAGGALAFALHALLLQIAIGYLYALGPALGRALGAKREADMMPALRAAAITLVTYAALASVVYFQSGAILVGLGQDGAASGEAQRFLRVAAAALPFGIGFVLLSEFLVAHERGDDILKVTLVGVVLNFALDGVLMAGWLGGPRLGVTGCSVATAISSAVMFAILLARSWPLLRKYAAVGAAQGRAAPIGELLREGAPLAALEVLLFLFFTQMTLFIGHMGIAPLNAHSAVSQVTDILMYLVFGFGEASATRMGFLIGRGDARAVHVGVRAHLALSWVLGAVAALVLVATRPWLLTLFAGAGVNHAAADLFTRDLALCAALLMLINPTEFFLVSMLRAFSDNNYSLVASTVCFTVLGTGGGWVLTHQFGLGAPGVWLGITTAVAALSLLMWRRLRVKYLHVAPSPEPTASAAGA